MSNYNAEYLTYICKNGLQTKFIDWTGRHGLQTKFIDKTGVFEAIKSTSSYTSQMGKLKQEK